MGVNKDRRYAMILAVNLSTATKINRPGNRVKCEVGNTIFSRPIGWVGGFNQFTRTKGGYGED